MRELEVAKQLVEKFDWYNPLLDKYPNINIKKVANIMGRLLRDKQQESINYKITDKLEKQLNRGKKSKK